MAETPKTIGLAIEWQRCPDGVDLRPSAPDTGTEGEYFAYSSERRENYNLLHRDYQAPIVIDFVNADTDAKLIDFLSKYGMPGSISARLGYIEAINPRERRDQIISAVSMLRQHDMLRTDVLTWINAAFGWENNYTSLRPEMHLVKGMPQAKLNAENPYTFMLTELMFMAAGGVRFTSCVHCARSFVTGSGTGRTLRAEYCRPACRMAHVRAEERAATRAAIVAAGEAPSPKRFGDPCTGSKDGKQYLAAPREEYMRK